MWESLGYIEEPHKPAVDWPIDAAVLTPMTYVLYKNREFALWMESHIPGWCTIFRICPLDGLKKHEDFSVGSVTVRTEDVFYICTPDMWKVYHSFRKQLGEIKITSELTQIRRIADKRVERSEHGQ